MLNAIIISGHIDMAALIVILNFVTGTVMISVMACALWPLCKPIEPVMFLITMVPTLLAMVPIMSRDYSLPSAQH